MARHRRSKSKAPDQKVKAILETNSLVEAYQKLNPMATLKSARGNCHRLLKDPKVQEKLDKALSKINPITIDRDKLTKVLGTILGRWYNGQEKTADVLKALDLLSRLVPDFASKKEISHYHSMEESELDKEIENKYNRIMRQLPKPSIN